MMSLSRFASLQEAVLVSMVNTQLRDYFPRLEELAHYHDISLTALCEKLKTAGYVYVEEINQFRALP